MRTAMIFVAVALILGCATNRSVQVIGSDCRNPHYFEFMIHSVSAGDFSLIRWTDNPEQIIQKIKRGGAYTEQGVFVPAKGILSVDCRFIGDTEELSDCEVRLLLPIIRLDTLLIEGQK